MPVSTTQTIVGALIGVGFATQALIQWAWDSGSVSEVAASWGIAPAFAGAFAALVLGLVKYTVLERRDSFKWAMRLIPWYFGFTAAILALFIAIEASGSAIDTLGGGTIAGIVLAIFSGIIIICYVFFMPFFERKLIKKDTPLRVWHIPMGPHCCARRMSSYTSQARVTSMLPNYYEDAHGNFTTGKKDGAKGKSISDDSDRNSMLSLVGARGTSDVDFDVEKRPDNAALQAAEEVQAKKRAKSGYVPPYERGIVPVQNMWWSNPQNIWNWTKFCLLRGVYIDVSRNGRPEAP